MSVPPLSAKIPETALPHSMREHIDWLRLTRSRRVGPVTFIRLIREFGSAAAALEALPGIAADAGVKGYAATGIAEAETEWRAAEEAGAVPLLLGGQDYPALLALIRDPPPLLWAIGDVALGGRDCVALVGARNASALGCRMAARLAIELGEAGLVIASGLARGIDAAAHRAALTHGTIAAQAGGVDVVYPPENADLGAAIASDGLRLSEMPMGHVPKPQDFPRRNRVVSGLALGIVVVEGAQRSGSLITARAALDQGREVMAVPGNPMDARAGGCNQLIREGATLIRNAEDILEALGKSLTMPEARSASRDTASKPPDPVIRPTAEPESFLSRLLSILGPVPVQEDVLTRELGTTAAIMGAALLDLELEGRIARHPGGMISRPMPQS